MARMIYLTDAPGLPVALAAAKGVGTRRSAVAGAGAIHSLQPAQLQSAGGDLNAQNFGGPNFGGGGHRRAQLQRRQPVGLSSLLGRRLAARPPNCQI